VKWFAMAAMLFTASVLPSNAGIFGGTPFFTLAYSNGLPNPGQNNYNLNCSGANCGNTNFSGITGAMNGDTFIFAWPSGSSLIGIANDTDGANYSYYGAGGANLAIISVTGDPLTPSWVISNVNQMTDYGIETACNTGGWSDNKYWKATGIISISGEVYLSVARQGFNGVCSQVSGGSVSTNSSIIKSSDGGATWTNPAGTTNSTGAAPAANTQEFSGTIFGAPTFVDYGMQNGACPASNPDNCSTYVYATSTPCWTECTTMYVGRASISADLTNPSNWSFVTAVDSSGNATWGSIGSAVPVLTYAGGLEMTPMTYVSSISRYIKINAFYPNPSTTNSTNLSIVTCTHPWVCSVYSAGTSTATNGYYGVNIVSKWSNFISGVLTLIYSGNYGTASQAPNTTLYQPTTGQLTVAP
jgi:hypothetical protein